jgi:hydroxyethylthiazole kinase-like uncharacterized protein yjeF
MKLVNAEESRLIDRLSREKFNVPSYSLMTRAGEAVALALVRKWPEASEGGVLVVAGKGNNGGDGMVAARRLKQNGTPVQVALLAKVTELKGDAARAAGDFAAQGGRVIEAVNEEALTKIFGEKPGAIIDAIFGTGLNAKVTGLAAHAITLIDAPSVPVVAIDIASGVNADTGEVMGCAVKATLTVTFGLAKFGHFSYPGADYCGELEIAGIGFPRQAIEEVGPRGLLLERDDVRPLLKPRAVNSHKGTYGHPLVVAAGRGKAGAALLSARAALRMGAGLVSAAIPDSVASIVAAGQAELMTEPMPDRDGHFDGPMTSAALKELLGGKTAIVCGPGIGVSDDTKKLIAFILVEAAQPNRPALIDADGLNALAELGCETARRANGPIVLTPHPGEMARLLKSTTAEVNANRIGAARQLCERTGAYVLLKGARSVIAGPGGDIRINSTGNPGMGTPGMGDALSGMIGALLGQGMAPIDALSLGVFLHAAAADRVAARRGPIGYITGDLIEELPSALNALMSEAESKPRAAGARAERTPRSVTSRPR